MRLISGALRVAAHACGYVADALAPVQARDLDTPLAKAEAEFEAYEGRLESDGPDATMCTCPSWGNPNWPHRHGCPQDSVDAAASGAAAGSVGDSPPTPDESPTEPPSLEDWIQPAVLEVLAEHEMYHDADLDIWCTCDSITFGDQGDWREHAAQPLIAAVLNAIRSYPGVHHDPAQAARDADMRVAAALYEQHTKRPK